MTAALLPKSKWRLSEDPGTNSLITAEARVRDAYEEYAR